jgi:SAM-dependent methyltransferase
VKFCGRTLDIVRSDEALTVAALRERGAGGRFLTLGELQPQLRDPLGRQPLSLQGERLVGGVREYPVRAGCPLLFPCDLERVAQVLERSGALAAFAALSPLEQYCAFGLLKGANNINNLVAGDPWYERHLWRSARMLREAQGRFLDIGCDDALMSRGMLPPEVAYVGLEPSSSPSPVFRVGGLGEFLPFADCSFDAVGFQTSLDHIFDYHLALTEARRVLRTGGRLYLATLLWTAQAQLHTDTVHFHHFRPGEIESALAEGFEIEHVDAYVWKDNAHRFGVYLRAVKR